MNTYGGKEIVYNSKLSISARECYNTNVSIEPVALITCLGQIILVIYKTRFEVKSTLGCFFAKGPQTNK
jgi:hypothetical protein